MADEDEILRLELLDTSERTLELGLDEVLLTTNAGQITCRLHRNGQATAGVVWVGGAGGGLDGPAGGLYPRLAAQLAAQGVESLRLDYRRPNDLIACILDTLLGAGYLQGRGIDRLALVGHSFGGAVVISAGVASSSVFGVAALSSQTYGTDLVRDLGPRSLLLMHGSADSVLPDSCSRDIFRRARDPKEVLLYPGCGHGLDECREAVDRDLLRWLRQVLLGENGGQVA